MATIDRVFRSCKQCLRFLDKHGLFGEFYSGKNLHGPILYGRFSGIIDPF